MAEKISNHAARRPRLRVPSSGANSGGLFYPGEVARLTDFTDLDYRQLRRLFKLVREQAAAPAGAEGKWSRFTLRDIAALKIAVGLCKNAEDPDSRYLVIAPLERACVALRAQGIENPILDVPMFREGRVIFAEIDGAKIDPTTGQMQLRDAHDRVLAYLDDADFSPVALAERSAVRQTLRSQASRRRPRPTLAEGYVSL